MVCGELGRESPAHPRLPMHLRCAFGINAECVAVGSAVLAPLNCPHACVRPVVGTTVRNPQTIVRTNLDRLKDIRRRGTIYTHCLVVATEFLRRRSGRPRSTWQIGVSIQNCAGQHQIGVGPTRCPCSLAGRGRAAGTPADCRQQADAQRCQRFHGRRHHDCGLLRLIRLQRPCHAWKHETGRLSGDHDAWPPHAT